MFSDFCESVAITSIKCLSQFKSKGYCSSHSGGYNLEFDPIRYTTLEPTLEVSYSEIRHHEY